MKHFVSYFNYQLNYYVLAQIFLAPKHTSNSYHFKQGLSYLYLPLDYQVLKHKNVSSLFLSLQD